MVKKIDTAVVTLWGEEAGAVAWLEDRGYAVFEFTPSFLKKGLDISPIHMALAGDGIFSFPGLNRETFLGLPGLLADALPDKFGNSVIDAWLARNGRDAGSFSPVERLCYTGRRGMGALEFSPPANRKFETAVPVEIAGLVSLAQEVMASRSALEVTINDTETENAEAILDILRVGTSAGGARPKAVIAMDDTGRVISGQTDVPAGFDYWLLKFDGVSDLELGKPQGYGRIEYAYSLMAKEAGIAMADCRLLEENGRAHFLANRFDRQNGRKIHLQSLCGLAHFDFNQAGAYSYEQAFAVMRRLRLSKAEAVQQFRRMVFNVIARNQDDHTKNIAFLMDQDGKWHLSPAFDVTYSHNPGGRWTNQHQMSINGKRDHFTIADLIKVGESISLPRPKQTIDEVCTAVAGWPDFARLAGIKQDKIGQIAGYHRLGLANS
jgi:serine/threonine-protein kinase HipA